MKSHGFWRNFGQGRFQTSKWTCAATLALSIVALTPIPAVSAAEPSSANDEYSFDWLDPDKKIYVLQNRRYRKAQRVFASAMAGFGLSNPYRDSYLADARIGYYFSELIGFEAYYNYVADRANSTYEALVNTGGALPGSREINSSFGGLVHYSPWYAKINVFNAILYFDWYFTAGLARLDTAFDERVNKADNPDLVSEPKTAFVLGTGQAFHLSDSLDLRIDFKSEIFKARYQRTDASKEAYFSNVSLVTGVTLKF